MKLLVANRGEIAVRIMRAAAELGVEAVAVFSEDDANSLHTRRASEAHLLTGKGADAYLNMEQILSVAKKNNCDAIHPGYGFLSENATFAQRCEDQGLYFVGPRPETLEIFGDKARALALADSCNVPVLSSTPGPVSLDQAKAFLSSLGEGGAIMIKAIAGGGGRGIRAVYDIDNVEEAYKRCQSEALQAMGNGDLYVERLMTHARHIEVQIVGDGTGMVSHLYERECSIQRQHQKIIEIAPCPTLSPAMRTKLTTDAVRMAEAVKYRNLGTFEFLVAAESAAAAAAAADDDATYAFIEANPRLQVEHTITEEVMDIDLVNIQLQLAAGKSFETLHLLQSDIPEPKGFAIQARINMETMGKDGVARPAGGKLIAFEAPSGRGVRTDTAGYVGFQTNPNFDSLLAKLIGHTGSPHFSDAVSRTYRALCEFKIEGVSTNIPLLLNLLQHNDFVVNTIHTEFVGDQIKQLVAHDNFIHERLFFEHTVFEGQATQSHAGAKVDETDPLAVLDYGKTKDASPAADTPDSLSFGMEGTLAIKALMQGTIVSLDIQEGDLVVKDQPIMVMSSMKMEHVIKASTGGLVVRLAVAQDDTVLKDQPLVFIEERDVAEIASDKHKETDLDAIRSDLAEVMKRKSFTLDTARPDKVEKRKKRGQRTARENIEDLIDPNTFIEYGALALAGQRNRRSLEDLIQNTPADGMVSGIGTVNGDLFGPEKSRSVVMSYDYMVLAGTQGMYNHHKKDRMFDLARQWRLPVVVFSEGGGGRPGDTDMSNQSGLSCLAFRLFGDLSGLVPLVGINSGRCFAGNAVLLGCCDVIIATENSNIGMSGPAMIEGGDLGVFRPEDIGPVQVQVPNGSVDIVVADEEEAVQVAKQYLSYFQGPIDQWNCADQRLLRNLIPENRLRIYDTRAVIKTLADTGCVLELRRHFGVGIITALIRIEGQPIGIIANNPVHLSGAIDSPASDKSSRFMQLCDAFDIPLLFLVDTPGFMVGPEVEKTALVRHQGRMFVTGASLTVPTIAVVLRKAYGLGAQAMLGGSLKAPSCTVSWPTGELGGMGLEGAVKLGFRKELAAIENPEERKKLYDNMVADAYENFKSLNMATVFDVDDVIDPADTRHLITQMLQSAPPVPSRTGKKRPCVDTW